MATFYQTLPGGLLPVAELPLVPSGDLPADVAYTDVANTFTAHQTLDTAKNLIVGGTATVAGNLTVTAGTATVGKALYPGTVTPTYAATMSVNPALGNTIFIAALHATTDASTLNLSASPVAGQDLVVVMSSDHADPELTLGTHFLSTATVKPGSGKRIAVTFKSDGTNAIEIARSAAY